MGFWVDDNVVALYGIVVGILFGIVVWIISEFIVLFIFMVGWISSSVLLIIEGIIFIYWI